MTLPADAFDRAGFRLPTEAEWEYFCRAGTETCRPFGDSDAFLKRFAWTWSNSGELYHPPGELLPNEFGLFDTLGGQWEWCHDGPEGTNLYPEYPKNTPDHPAPDPFRGMPRSADDWRVVRGGSFDSGPSMARSAHRDIFKADTSRYFTGFRIVRTIPSARPVPRRSKKRDFDLGIDRRS